MGSADYERSHAQWTKRIIDHGLPSEARSSSTELMIQAYGASHSSITSLEGKGVGTLQASAVILAIIVFSLAGSDAVGPQVLSLTALIYLSTSVSAATLLLRPIRRFFVIPDDALLTTTNGLAELAACTDANKLQSVRANNLLHAATTDAARAGLLATAAISWQMLLK